MKKTIEETLKQTKVMVLDGATGSALEMLGCNINHRLWTAKVLADQPDKIYEAHMGYLKAGADALITSSYQATIPGLLESGYSLEDAERIIKSSVTICQKAIADWWEAEGKDSGRAYPLCLAAMGPYGAYLADGSEYTGAYAITEEGLREFYVKRMDLLLAEDPDIVLIETQPSLREALIACDLCEEKGADYWISFSCRDGHHTNAGQTIEEVCEAFKKDHPHCKMIGVNCTAPKHIVSLIKDFKENIDIPVAVYPNSGETYNAVTKTWSGIPDGLSFGEYAAKFMEAGADCVGGCCTTVDSHIRQVTEARDAFVKA